MEIKKGDQFTCIEDVIMDTEERAYTAGCVYKSEIDGCITDDEGDYNHSWRGSKEDLERHFVRFKATDSVNHPPHYTQGKVESIDAIESALGVTGFEGFLAGNCMKYIHRYKHKNGIEDLKKASWYLNRLIKTLESYEETT